MAAASGASGGCSRMNGAASSSPSIPTGTSVVRRRAANPAVHAGVSRGYIPGDAMRLIPLALVASMVAAPLSAQWTTSVDGYQTCRPIWREYGRMMHGHADAVYCEVREIGAFKPSGAIEVDGGDRAGVTVQGSPRADARVRLVIQAQGRTVEDAKALAQRATLDLNARPLRISGIDEERRSDDHFVAAIILIDAPEKSDLTLRVNYAPLEVEGVTGRMDVRAAYGPLTLRDVAGDVRARVDHGPLTVEVNDAQWRGAGLDA